jgi:hypothetical protein
MGEVVTDVQLPDWAETAEIFVLKMRKALEKSPIECWIDLVFGC